MDSIRSPPGRFKAEGCVAASRPAHAKAFRAQTPLNRGCSGSHRGANAGSTWAPAISLDGDRRGCSAGTLSNINKNGDDMAVKKSGARKLVTRVLATRIMLSMYAFGVVATTGAMGVSPAYAQRGRGRGGGGRGRGYGGGNVGAKIALGIGATVVGSAIAASAAPGTAARGHRLLHADLPVIRSAEHDLHGQGRLPPPVPVADDCQRDDLEPRPGAGVFVSTRRRPPLFSRNGRIPLLVCCDQRLSKIATTRQGMIDR